MSEFDENRAYEKGYEDGCNDAAAKVAAEARKDLAEADKELDMLRERVRELNVVLKKLFNKKCIIMAWGAIAAMKFIKWEKMILLLLLLY